MASVARFIRSFGFGIVSVGLHLTLVVLCVLFATPAADSMAADKEWIEVEMQPALGQPHGKDKGKDLGSHKPKPPPPKMPEPEPFEAPPPLPPSDPEAIPTSSASVPPPDAGPPVEADAGDAGAVPEGGVSDDGGEYDPTTPVGSENVPPGFGSPDGVPDGQGTSIRKTSPQYKAILHGWALARFPRLANKPAGIRPCATVSIQISPGRQVTGASMSPSGNETWDQHVRGSLSRFQGATVPADPEGGPVPPVVHLYFCWD